MKHLIVGREALFAAAIGITLLAMMAGGYLLASQRPDMVTLVPASTADRWQTVVAQSGGFSMRLPDGWRVTSFANDVLGGTAHYTPNNPATVQPTSAIYDGSPLLLVIRVAPWSGDGLEPSWQRPQPTIIQTTQEFAIGDLKGKHYTAFFTNSKQTKHEYVFDLKNGKKLDVLYTLAKGEKDGTATVEKAIKTIIIKR